jgi:hypothetical protein
MRTLLRLLSTLALSIFLFGPFASAARAADTGSTEAPAVSQAKDFPKKPDFSDLTPEEIQIYRHGAMSTGQRVGGGLLGTFAGFGTGHIVYGMYGSKGWIFTVGEAASLGMAVGGAVLGISGCSTAVFEQSGSGNCGGGLALYFVGSLTYIGFRIWEIIDVWTIPGSYNARYRAINEKANPDSDSRSDRGVLLLPIVASNVQGTGMNYGLGLTVKF